MMNGISAFLFYFLHHFLGLNDEYYFNFSVISKVTFSPSFLFDFGFMSPYFAQPEGTVCSVLFLRERIETCSCVQACALT